MRNIFFVIILVITIQAILYAAGETPKKLYKLTAVDETDYDNFGESVAISGNTIVIGTTKDDDGGKDSGSVYVFQNNVQVAKLTASDAAPDDHFGCSVAVDGDTVVVGAEDNDDNGSGSGSAYVFVKPWSGWTDMNQSAKLLASNAKGYDRFGTSVAVSGNTVVVGASGQGAGGAAYVYVIPSRGWSGTLQENARLSTDDENEGDYLGVDVGISGDTVVVGASGDDINGLESGIAYIFEKNPRGWYNRTHPDARLTPSDGAASDRFGISVTISGDTVAIGAIENDDNGSNSGSAYVFVKPTGGWTDMNESAKLTASDGSENDKFGSSVAISGNTVVVGAPFDDDESGSAYIFMRPADQWVDTSHENAKITDSNATNYSYFGWSTAINGDSIVVSSPHDNAIAYHGGSACVFSLKQAPLLPSLMMYLLN